MSLIRKRKKKMEFKNVIRQYRNIIIFAGLGVGLIFALDATGIYSIGFAEMGWYVQYGGMAVMALAGYVYYEVFINTPKQRKTQRGKPQRQEERYQQPPLGHNQAPSQLPPQQPVEKPIRNLEEIGPPEMGGQND